MDSRVPPSATAAGRLLDGRYQIERLLGGGGMAAVWRARDLRLDRPVAIKELSGEGLRQSRALERFDREARAVARLSHPNVVAVHDFGTDDGAPYLVMELVEGPTIAKLLADGPLPVADVLAVAAQVCDGLSAAHVADIVHRDIKPANLILTPSGVVKICDFGVARLLDPARNGNLTGPATAMGSPSYMAPEQITGGPVDPRTDLYALGCTMYTMLTGSPPFTAGGPFGIVHQHLTARPEPLRLHRPEVPPAVESLVADLLAKQPDQRPPDARTVRSRIAAVQTDPAAAAPSPHLRPAAAPAVGATPATPVAPSAGVEPPSIANAGARTPTQRGWAIAAASAALAAALAAVAVPAMIHRTEDAAARWTGPSAATATSPAPVTAISSTSARPSRAAPSTTAPSTSTAQTGPATPPPPPADPILALRQAIGQQVAAGGLRADAAADLNKMVDDLAKAIATPNPDDETTKLKALRAKLTTLHNEGKLSDDGYRVLNSAVDQVTATASPATVNR